MKRIAWPTLCENLKGRYADIWRQIICPLREDRKYEDLNTPLYDCIKTRRLLMALENAGTPAVIDTGGGGFLHINRVLGLRPHKSGTARELRNAFSSAGPLFGANILLQATIRDPEAAQKWDEMRGLYNFNTPLLYECLTAGAAVVMAIRNNTRIYAGPDAAETIYDKYGLFPYITQERQAAGHVLTQKTPAPAPG